jgi:hypothetical protein
MISNRRLIAMIGGRAKVGDPMPFRPLAARPRVVRVLRRSIVAVGASGLVVAGLSTLGGGMLDASASAAVSAGGSRGAGTEQPVVADVAPNTPVVLADLQSVGATATVLLSPSTTAPKPKAKPSTVAPRTTVPPKADQRSTAMAASPPPPAGTVEAVIMEVFGPEHGRAAIGVARCESHLNPAAISRGGGNWGLFQINTAHRGRVAAMGYQWEDLLDARVNALVAKSIFDQQGWQPWGCRRAAH